MKNAEALILLSLLINLNPAFCQTPKKEYVKLTENGIEFQTNGIDTLCIIDSMPEFPGGLLKMTEFLSNNIIYPKKARRDEVEGRLVLSFVVDKSGKIQNILVIKSVRADLDNEAIRVVKNMPKWKPGVQKGSCVQVQYQLPVMFKLN